MWKSMVKMAFGWGTLKKDLIKSLYVANGLITKDDYKEITGEDYAPAETEKV
ncbi:hypothetical protein JCM14202_3035 [Agrilactobacillus composti DSM 18527 = JCM 14202]|uniref:XkdX family protein n=1 Tax=Agrilactobacillus composti TaxID=398555 RepID=UPI00042E03F0|nr:XkdX family protein [Agrilactobacillus composti]GAF41111.1 hypothetical protein JCM14202_3035 [Agrilactobacillus composti DSM 18527 = JCM 14202]